MKKQILMAVSLLILIMSASSCGNGNLSKDDAKKQIDEYINQEYEFAYFDLTGFGSKETTAKHLYSAKGAGLLDYTITAKQYYYNGEQKSDGYFNVTLFDKIKPLILKETEEGGGLYSDEEPRKVAYYRPGTYAAEIVSISEPAPDYRGTIVCHVTLKCSFTLNELGKCFEYDCQYDKPRKERPITFTKQQDGWRLEGK